MSNSDNTEEYKSKKARMSNKRYSMLIVDLWWLRYEKTGDQWYELTDYLRDKLAEDGFKISYDDKNEDFIINGKSMRESTKRQTGLSLEKWLNIPPKEDKHDS